MSKLLYFSALAEHSAEQLTKSREQWTAFLTTVARLYKYPYYDQLLIHAQRPQATACAEYDFWRNRMNRYVKRGSHGIGLIDVSGMKPRLHYVFDVADTGERADSRPVQLWKMEEEHRKPIEAALEYRFGTDAELGLAQQISMITDRLALDYWSNCGKQVLDIIADSYLEGYDERKIENEFRMTASFSASYALYSRCMDHPDDYIDKEDFREIFDFNTAGTVNALGTAVSEISAEVFREIEIAVRNYEKSRQEERSSRHDERTDIHETGRVLSSESDIGRDGRAASGQIRDDAQEISAGEQADSLQRPDPEREVVRPSAGDRRDSKPENGADDERTVGEESGSRQEDASDGMGAAYERPESAGGGSDPKRAYQQLSLDLTPSRETENITVRTEEAASEEPAAFSVGEVQSAEPENFHITDEHLGEGGAKTKYRRNVEAIRTLQQIEASGRYATPEEQEILSRYVGWGGLADAFDSRKDNWASEYQELRGLLSEEEYASARASTLNAHYTSPAVIGAIYEAVERMGFNHGNILEPSMGIGNFFGMLPESMRESRLYGVELDPITGRIAKQLYPLADITVAGFETTDRRAFFDLAVGNVPFGNYKVRDKGYDRLNFSIHNYFFAKTLDQVRPGGIIAFVTSRYTMDAKDPSARKYLAQRAELLGAIRLPNNAFRANAGTDVVSDILFLQKRDHPVDIEPDWVHLDMTPEGFPINSYFTEHPEMILGELTSESTQYGKEECTVVPIPGRELSEQLREAVGRLHGRYLESELANSEADEILQDVIPADPDVKNYSYTVLDGEVYYRENSVMRRMELNDTAKERVKGMVQLREIIGELMEYQLEDCPDEMIREKQEELNRAYDEFTGKYGIINSRGNAQAFSDDSAYYLLCSLENIDEDGKMESKADMFTKRTIRPERKVTSVDTPEEALAISIGEHGKVDLPYMSELLGTPGEYDRITEELRGVIFKDPLAPEEPATGWQTADEYLSGDVRSKLRIAQMAAEKNPDFAVNVEALRQAQPKDLDASEIDVRLGATWIDRDYIQQFMEETFDTPFYLQRNIQVNFSSATAEWWITGKSAPGIHDVNAYVTYGTNRANAYKILEETLNLKDIRIYDTYEDADGKKKRVLNKKETTLAQQKQQAIKDAFANWIWRDPQRREELVKHYNELFNSTRPREYDGSHIRFGGMNPDIKLRPHQLNAIAHVLYGGNTLLAHEVGAGKTFEMAASAMESKRLGLCQKSMFVVPNHLTLQWANEFLRLYPGAKLLVATKKDFETARRKKFCARIATGDYDAVIIGHSQFEKIPISAERQERLLQEQIDDIEDAIAELKYSKGETFTIKQMEKTRKTLQTRLDKLMAEEKKDDVVTFEQLGVDRLFVDESHAFKNLFLYTKMRNVAGLSTSEAQKSSDMFMKCRYMDEITGGRGIVFATGTPVSNSMSVRP